MAVQSSRGSLCLKAEDGTTFTIGDDILIVVKKHRPHIMKLVFIAPKDVHIQRIGPKNDFNEDVARAARIKVQK